VTKRKENRERQGSLWAW